MVSQNSIDALAERASTFMERNQLATEEATKHALVLPFLQALGYDIFNPDEVMPEYTADFGIRQGEKVDYAVMDEAGDPAILIECKKVADTLDIQRASQLGRYFAQTAAHIGVLTNGVIYQFYSDLDAENVMDSTPFLVLDVTDLGERDRNALRHFAKHTFDVDEARKRASNMKHVNGLKEYLSQAIANPEEDFVRFLSRKVYSGIITQPRLEHFTGLTKIALQGFVNDRINSTLRRASDIANAPETEDDGSDEPDIATGPDDDTAKDIITTAEELAAYELVKSIVSEVIDEQRVFIRDTKSYCSVIVDDTRLQQICRFRFNSPRVKYLVFLYEDSNQYGRVMRENRIAIQSVGDIANYTDELKDAARMYVDANG